MRDGLDTFSKEEPLTLGDGISTLRIEDFIDSKVSGRNGLEGEIDVSINLSNTFRRAEHGSLDMVVIGSNTEPGVSFASGVPIHTDISRVRFIMHYKLEGDVIKPLVDPRVEPIELPSINLEFTREQLVSVILNGVMVFLNDWVDKVFDEAFKKVPEFIDEQ